MRCARHKKNQHTHTSTAVGSIAFFVLGGTDGLIGGVFFCQGHCYRRYFVVGGNDGLIGGVLVAIGLSALH